MKAASRKITFQLTPGQYRYAGKQAAAQGYPSPDLFCRSRALEPLSTSIIPGGRLHDPTHVIEPGIDRQVPNQMAWQDTIPQTRR